MCGIVLIHDRELSEKKITKFVSKALDKQSHRGPDDRGIWHHDCAAIGHCRLSIIDLGGSAQPMQSEDDRFVLSYNGEIYNYRDLRKRLENKWSFRTTGDTEVLLAGLVLAGVEFLEEMEGMWAFALWDLHEQKLLMGRDRIGKKPLYYYDAGHSFYCASELPALTGCIDTKLNEDLDSTSDFLKYGYYLPGNTAYKEIKEILPGHYTVWKPDAELESRSYWNLSLSKFSFNNRNAAAEALRKALIDSVEKRLVADVEVGAFLSGGVDSSLIVSILTNILNVRPKTFTIGFKERSYDERNFAQQVADYCKTDHHVEILEGWKQEKLTEMILNNVGQPFADSSLLPTALVSEVASKRVKVALSGDGGDELFSGYQRYQARSLLRWYTRLPKTLQRGVAEVLKQFPEPMKHHSRSLLKKAHLFQDIVNRLEFESPYFAPILYDKNTFYDLIPEIAQHGHTPLHLPEQCEIDDISRMMTADALIYLPQDILLKVDRASMSHSLESRAPFLDRKVVEIAFSIPRKWHRSYFRGKRMLSRAFHDLLPESIWTRRKQGFGVPIHNWFRENLGDELKELLFSCETPFNNEVVLNMLAQHQNRGRDNGYRLWSIYIYLLWKENSRNILS